MTESVRVKRSQERRVRWRRPPAGPWIALTMAWRAGAVWAVSIAAVTAVSSGVPVAVAWLTKLVLDRLAGGPGALPDVLGPALALMALGLVAGVQPSVRRFAGNELDRRISLLAQDRLYTAVSRLSGLARFEDPVFIDRLRLATQAGGSTPGQVLNAVFAVAGGLITLAGFLVSLLTISPPMAVVLLLGAVPVLGAELVLARRRAASDWRLGPVERREFLYATLLSSANAAKEIRLFGLAAFLHDRMLRERSVAERERRGLDRSELRIQLVLGLTAALVAGGGLVWAITQAGRGALSVGDVSMFVASVAGVQGGLSGIITEIAVAARRLLLFQHYLAVVGTEPDLRGTRRELPPLTGGIEFRDVWFRYGPEHPWVLRGVSLVVPYGRGVGLVGGNGSGKSTLVKLLCRFYDPEKGAVLWDGVDLREIDPAVLRARISGVFQDYMQYDMTAGENIGLGDLDRFTDRAAVREAARRAGAEEFVAALPRGYDTLITRVFFDSSDDEEGVFLSGGQGQRVAVARAMLRGDRDVLILDEPSSGLDAEAEHELHTRLKEHRRGRTSLLISHRLGAVRDADVLVVLENGVVAEQGTHDELMAAGGVYARMFTIQASGYREPDRPAMTEPGPPG